MLRQFELVERVKSYDAQADEDQLNRAYVYAIKMHGSQKRASGDPYFSHPIEVAGILSDLRIDSETIVTALLHDVVEDTDASIEDIAQLFGANVARLVDGVTKLGKMEIRSEQSKYAENFRKLLLAMSEDIRVLLVKLADRLHNMRTLHFIKSPDKRQRISSETLEIYAPLAERIGMQRFKDELEDLAFAQLQPDARGSIVRRLDFMRGQGEDLTKQVIAALSQTLDEEGLKAEISGRVKSPFSIWTKMRRKNVEFEQMSDIMAFRIEVESITDCYHALGVLHGHYQVIPGRFKDYISTPKPNGYRSLHSGLMGPRGQRIEVQIRTHKMQEVAELGVAAHWSYKEGSGRDGTQYRWVRELLDILEHAPTPEEFLEHTKLEMFQDQVFCFTPKGALIALPRGSCPVDFAYAVHSEVGDTCVGAKVNGRQVPLRANLANGDQVEIQTSRAQSPSPGWEDFVVTGKAKARIRRFVRSQQRDEHAKLGRQLLARQFRDERLELTEKGLEGVLRKLKQDSVTDLQVAVGQGNLSAREVLTAVYPQTRQPLRDKALPNATPGKRKTTNGAGNGAAKGSGHALPIKGLIAGMAVHYAHCCHPLPGDRIVGIVTTGRGVTVHTIHCDTLQTFDAEPERWIDLSWDEPGSEQSFHGRLKAVITNEPGSLGDFTTIIGKAQGNIADLKFTNRSMDFFEVLVDVEVQDLKHLTDITAALRAAPSISSVERARG
ncbi:MAG: bifunctional (p)ppGpp synthetase/guanosine-3',5'-bis(diphosphate) 3'-pyrophosphohydrolase [Rhodospirillales bacterium]